MLKRINWPVLAITAILAFFLTASVALGATVASSTSLVLKSQQTWLIIISAFVPLVTYVLNRVGPWVTEPAKAFVTVLASAVAGGVYTAAATSSFGWNAATAQMVLTSVAAALAAHHFLWKPSGVSTLLGAGTNGSLGGKLVWQKHVPPEAPAEPAA